jgi:hypothetical protein
MTTNKVLLIGCCLLVTVLIMQCSNRLAGVETTNGCTVFATASGIEGTVPPSSRVFIFDTTYIPYVDSGVGIGTAADNNGFFRFNTPPGKYNVFIVGPTGELAGVAINSPSTDGDTSSKQLPLQDPGAVSGTLSDSATSDTLLIFLEGMCHYQVTTAAHSFFLKNIPEGTYQLKIARLSSLLNSSALKIIYVKQIKITRGATTEFGEARF